MGRTSTKQEEILAFIQENHMELSAEQMEQISDGYNRTLNHSDAGCRE